MKKYLAIFLVMISLCGCASSNPEATEQEVQVTEQQTVALEQTEAAVQAIAETEQKPVAESPEEEHLLDIFAQHARPGAEAIDCVMMEQTACDIAGVVQYTLGDPNVCRFDFIRKDDTLFRMGMEFSTDGERTLQCAGEDRVSLRIVWTDGSTHNCTIFYYEDAETGEKGFKVSESN